VRAGGLLAIVSTRVDCWRANSVWLQREAFTTEGTEGHRGKLFGIDPGCQFSMTSSNIHPTAIIHTSARVPGSCKIGPYCVIGADVELGEGCHLVSHVAIEGPTKIGADNGFFPFSAIGMAPQDVTYKGEPTRLEIGSHNEIREYVTINRGTLKGGGLTKVGSHLLIMAYTHIGHDCVIEDHAMLVNGATLGGHVTVEEWAVVGALCPIHQF